jgi:hypothetical protein
VKGVRDRMKCGGDEGMKEKMEKERGQEGQSKMEGENIPSRERVDFLCVFFVFSFVCLFGLFKADRQLPLQLQDSSPVYAP